jgi:hypothetical protein
MIVGARCSAVFGEINQVRIDHVIDLTYFSHCSWSWAGPALRHRRCFQLLNTNLSTLLMDQKQEY